MFQIIFNPYEHSKGGGVDDMLYNHDSDGNLYVRYLNWNGDGATLNLREAERLARIRESSSVGLVLTMLLTIFSVILAEFLGFGVDIFR